MNTKKSKSNAKKPSIKLSTANKISKNKRSIGVRRIEKKLTFKIVERKPEVNNCVQLAEEQAISLKDFLDRNEKLDKYNKLELLID